METAQPPLANLCEVVRGLDALPESWSATLAQSGPWPDADPKACESNMQVKWTLKRVQQHAGQSASPSIPPAESLWPCHTHTGCTTHITDDADVAHL